MGRIKELLMEFCGAIFPDSWDEQEAFQTAIMDGSGEHTYDGEPNRGAFLRFCHKLTDDSIGKLSDHYDSYENCRGFLNQGCLEVPYVPIEIMSAIVEDFHKNKTPQSAPPLTLRRVARVLDLMEEEE